MGEAENKVGLVHRQHSGPPGGVPFVLCTYVLMCKPIEKVLSLLQTLVFVETKRKTDELTRRLRSQGYESHTHTQRGTAGAKSILSCSMRTELNWAVLFYIISNIYNCWWCLSHPDMHVPALCTLQLAGPLYPWRQTAAGKRLCAPGYVHSCHCPCVIHHDILSGFLLFCLKLL